MDNDKGIAIAYTKRYGKIGDAQASLVEAFLAGMQQEKSQEKWIATIDKMPPEHKEVLCWHERGSYVTFWIGDKQYQECGLEIGTSETTFRDCIKYWMPLPKTPWQETKKTLTHYFG